MTKEIVPILSGLAVTKNTDYEAAPGGVLAFLNYKSSTDKVTKVVTPAASSFVFCYPELVLPVIAVPALDVILRSAMAGYAESLCRVWREEEGNPEALEVSLDMTGYEDGTGKPEAFLDAVIAHAEEKAAGSKLSERIISSWFLTEGSDAVKAQYMVANKLEAENDAVTKAVANMGVLFGKLAAPTPDISPDIAVVLLTRLSVLDQPSSTCQAIRQKLQARVDVAKKAANLLSAI